MTNELINLLVALTLVSSVGIVAVLLLRRAARLAFGAIASYYSWLFVPLSLIAALAPHTQSVRPTWEITLAVKPLSALGQALNASVASSMTASPWAHWPLWILAAWALGVVMFGIYLAGLQHAYVRSLGRLTGRGYVLWAEHSARSPAVVGVLHPRLVLPADFKARYTRHERHLILAHERTHVRRGDGVWNAAAALLRCLFWFNPLVHLGFPYFRLDQEVACDEAVLSKTQRSKRTYASAMLKTQLADAEMPVGCHWRAARHLRERLRMIKKTTPSRMRRKCGYLCVAIASPLVSYVAWALQPATAPGVAVTAPSAPRPDSLPPTESPNAIYLTGKGAAVEDAGNGTRAAGPHLQLTVGRPIHFQSQADAVTYQPDGSEVLTGHVRITVQVVRAMRPGGHMIATEVRALVANAESAKISRLPEGGVVVDLENASVQIDDAIGK